LAKDKRDISIFLVVLCFTISFFILKTYNDQMLFAEVVAFAIMGFGALLATLHTQSDEGYYRNLTPGGLLWIAAAAIGMFVLSSLFMAFFVGNAPVSHSVLWYPTIYAQLAETGVATSIFTLLLGEMVFQFSLVASAEELLKFAGYTEMLGRYGSKILAVALPVGLWAGYHMLQAYQNVALVVPAFLCGLILIGLLEVTKNPIACIMAHGAYNTATVIVALQANGIPLNVSWFPLTYGPGDILLVGLAAIWIALIVLPALLDRNK